MFSQRMVDRWGRLEIPGHPDGGLRLQAGHIAQYLAEVSMVGVIQLILNHHAAVVDRKGWPARRRCSR